MLVLAPDTGEVLEERAVDPTTSVAALGPDVVLQDVGADGRVRVTRSDPRSGEVRWTFTAPARRPRPWSALCCSDDGLVVVPGEAGWVLDGDGDVVHAVGRATVRRPRAGPTCGADAS